MNQQQRDDPAGVLFVAYMKLVHERGFSRAQLRKGPRQSSNVAIARLRSFPPGKELED